MRILISKLFQFKLPFYNNLVFAFGFLLLFFSKTVFAEGSKDLYPATAQGNRAFLYANIDNQNWLDRYPFKTRGAHFVYAKNGEAIAVASSAYGYQGAQIVITPPNGPSVIYNYDGSTGRIQNRAQELQGPRWSGAPAAGYAPVVVNVNAAQEGIWRVEFLAPRGNGNSDDISAADVAATANWTQPMANTSNLIAAWDVSVRNAAKTAWLTGRVYANVLNLSISPNFREERGFYVTNYILTEDGRAYRVQTNGNNGWAFTFFSNNNGFAVNGVPTYKSLNASTVAALSGLHDPRTLDDPLNKTHKIFYGKPNPDLPETANAFVTTANQTMWLKKDAILPIITDVKFIGVEGTEGKISRKGANISFNSSTSGSFQIVIPIASGANRIINGAAVQGYNEIFWDGKDGNGNFLSAGAISPSVQTFLRSAEVHFPYIDMEINPNGIIIELTENNTNYTVDPTKTNPAEYSDKVYWDDSSIDNAGNAGRGSSNPFVNLTGISSRSNGHKFGRYSTNTNATYHFGDARSMDTWAYIESDRNIHLVNIEVLEANLKIESISPDLSQYFSGNKITYNIRVQNDGPSAANGSRLAISLPAGLTIGTVTQANASTGVTVSNTATVGQTFSALLNLPNQGAIDFLVEATFTGSFNRVFDNTKASILRPADLTDPDATGNNAAGPVDADEECLNGATTGVGLCNNIKYNTVNGQEICQGSNITPIIYTLSPDGTQFENSTPLPDGLSAQNAGNNRTVSGALSASGIQTFFIKTLNTKRTQTNVILRSNALPDATANGPVSLCVDATGNPAISFKGSGSTVSYEFSYAINNGAVQTVTTPTGSDTATIAIPVNNTGVFTYKLISVKDLATGCSQTKNVEVEVTIFPKPAQAHIQLIQ
ncbi:hypothetical protein SAMN06297358_1555 [Pedobacter xixiisoli]|uniref:DUF11 domain-containing protein n=1 Tax=Pedobacter xixiisoli TaxID=1476464 RepID=A0A285ZXM6_9SPHI|nr:hypothetical protein SAMN06297358_1555 [Pedobacter xixiisoli]